jgi:uncharacterized membrane protein
MVLELKVPHSPDFRTLIPLWPGFLSYVLSFSYVGIYWNKFQCGSYLPHALISEPLKWLPILGRGDQ